jgi:hypothetical protein
MIKYYAGAYIAALAVLAIVGLALTLAAWELVRQRFPQLHAELGSISTIRGGWSWFCFFWSSQPRQLCDRSIERIALGLRIIHAIYGPTFLLLFFGFIWLVAQNRHQAR